MKKGLRYFNDPVLRTPCEPVEQFNQELIETIATMREIKTKYKGVGLAAPQIGVSKRIILVHDMIIINPFVLEVSNKLISEREGCLSYPNIFKDIKRPKWVEFKGLNETGGEVYMKIEGLTSRIFLHEIDHLIGKCLIGKK